ncbi:MAG: nicotinate-nucleotide adenylyltransferase [Cyanobacteriota bacterium]|jgi:nicotinate-nucleotide adenylyltransferase|nr:nicotinate-nucleotide adenylyltransferase [Cyanobacteriota bacterium]
MTGGSDPIALFGTSADPPTRGHRALLEGLLNRYPAVATWASDNPLKQHTAPLPLRVSLLRAVVEAIADPRLELHQELSSPWAIETLARARRRWPGRTPVLVIGSDLAASIHHWRQAEALLTDARLAVVPRAGWPLQAADLQRLQQAGAEVEVLPLTVPASASSRLRGDRSPGLATDLLTELHPLLLQENPYGLPLS